MQAADCAATLCPLRAPEAIDYLAAGCMGATFCAASAAVSLSSVQPSPALSAETKRAALILACAVSLVLGGILGVLIGRRAHSNPHDMRLPPRPRGPRHEYAELPVRDSVF